MTFYLHVAFLFTKHWPWKQIRTGSRKGKNFRELFKKIQSKFSVQSKTKKMFLLKNVGVIKLLADQSELSVLSSGYNETWMLSPVRTECTSVGVQWDMVVGSSQNWVYFHGGAMRPGCWVQGIQCTSMGVQWDLVVEYRGELSVHQTVIFIRTTSLWHTFFAFKHETTK